MLQTPTSLCLYRHLLTRALTWYSSCIIVKFEISLSKLYSFIGTYYKVHKSVNCINSRRITNYITVQAAVFVW